MSKVKILIVEDELIVSMEISDLLEELGYEVLKTVTNYEDAVSCLKIEEPDIALLDIQLEGEKDGIDLAQYIKENMNMPFIFLTSLADPRTINHAKTLNPNAYLVKPFNQDDLYTSIELAVYNFNNTGNEKIEGKSEKLLIKDAFFVKGTNLFHKVRFSEIMFVKSEHVYVEIYTVDKKRHLVRSSMGNFKDSLPENFYQIHRSYTINLDYLDSINSLYVKIKEHEIPIGRAYRNQLLKSIRVE
jgi:two-component system, LytTR family, response regulator